VIVLSCCLLACKSVPQRPNEYLDPVTAAMVASVSAPTIFARAHQDVAANARQYATVVGFSVNRSGHYDYFLLVYLWSTVDPRLAAGAHPGETMVLLADDRAIRMRRQGLSLQDAGIANPLDRPLHFHGQPRLYRTDARTLTFVSAARRLRLQFEGDPDARPFELWKDGRRELGQLASLAGGGH
jgi:hypothetical protein